MLVFIDMDGVVSDFDLHILRTYGHPMDTMSREMKDRFWDAGCVARRYFANSPPILEGITLVKRLESMGVPLSFLTSTGGELQHIDIAKQKLDFLHRHDLGHLPVAFATGTKSKASFASSKTILIDDREKVVTAFEEAGGRAILFSPDRVSVIESVVLGWVENDESNQ